MFLYILILLSLITFQGDTSVGCALYLNSTFYQLKSLTSSTNYTISNVTNSSTFSLDSIVFNICNNLKSKCNSTSKFDSYGVLYSSTNTSQCLDLAHTYTQESFSSKIYYNPVSKLNETYVELNYLNFTSPCYEDPLNQNINYTYIVNFFCDNTVKDSPIKTMIRDTCSVIINLRHDEACSMFRLGAIWDFFDQNYFLFFLILVPAGILVSLFGLKLFNPTLFVLGFLSASFAFIIIFYELLLPASSPQWVVYILVGVSVLVGIVVGYVLSINTRYGIFLLGCLLGYIVIMMLWSLFLHALFRESIIALYVLTILFMAGGAILGYWLHNQVIVIGTSYVGSYITFKGIGSLFGGFPNEYTLFQKIKNGEIASFGVSVYIYIILILIYGTVCLIYQEKKYYNIVAQKINETGLASIPLQNDQMNDDQNQELIQTKYHNP